jgi:hypothetical protein
MMTLESKHELTLKVPSWRGDTCLNLARTPPLLVWSPFTLTGLKLDSACQDYGVLLRNWAIL